MHVAEPASSARRGAESSALAVRSAAPATTTGVVTAEQSLRPRRLVRDLVSLARPGQWVKNFLVIPLVLPSIPTWQASALRQMLWAVTAFTLASVLVYVVNDIADHGRDRMHPVKRYRPIADKRISVRAAALCGTGVAGLLCAVLAVGPRHAALAVLAYLLMNVAYSSKLKHAPLVDVFIVSAGFVLRIVCVFVATSSPISAWLLIGVFSLCLLLSVGKRRHELKVSSLQHRPSLSGYSLPFADALIFFTAALTAVSYLLYLRTEVPVGPHSHMIVLVSVPCAFFGIFRYLQMVLVDLGGGDPVHALLHDRIMVANSVLWAALFAGALVVTHYPVLT